MSVRVRRRMNLFSYDIYQISISHHVFSTYFQREALLSIYALGIFLPCESSQNEVHEDALIDISFTAKTGLSMQLEITVLTDING